jgi:RNA polymerase sigma-70 factor (ECF subfamily)
MLSIVRIPPADPAGEADADVLGARLAARSGRLRLLLAHLAGRAVRARCEVDDLAQEVFVRALADPARLPRDDAAFDRHLALLARHVVVDAARALRAAKREGEAGAQPLGSSSTGGAGASRLLARTGGPATKAAAREQAADLVAAYLRLAPEHRRVLGLRQFQGLSAAEAAQRMGRSEVAVHSLYRRALESWGAALGQAPPA